MIATFGPNALVAREINDIFIVLVENIYIDFFGNLDEIYLVDSKIDEYDDSYGNKLKHSISEGIYVIENPNEDISYMLDCAHTARLEGKHTFGLTINIFTDEMLKRQYTKNTIESLMESSLNNEEFFLVLQPKYNLITGELIGSEALVRWQPEFGNMIYPDEFISIFEDNGFIKKIDFYIFEQVCKLLSNTEYKYPRISVNLSGVTATVDNVAMIYNEILNKYKLAASRIEIELTESAFVNNSKKVRKNIDDFKKFGFNLSIDDFGIGVSSLSRLKDMNVDELKLDKSFIGSNLLTDKGISIIKNIISLSKDLHLNVVAEGIETEEQLDILLNLGCDIGQGYYFAKPLKIDDFNSLVEKNYIIPIKEVKESLKTNHLINKTEGTSRLYSGVIICKNDPFFTILRANDEAYEILGFTYQEMISFHRNRLLNIIQGDTTNIANSIQSLKEGSNTSVHLIYKIKRKEDTLITQNFIVYDKIDDVFMFSIMDNSSFRKDSNDNLEISKYCSLTGFYNEFGLELTFSEMHNVSNPVCMFLVNISNLGFVNKKLGVKEGDSLLKEISSKLKTAFSKECLLARIEGNKFVLLFENTVLRNQIDSYVEKINDITNYVYKDIQISNYIGIAFDSAGKKNFQELVTDCQQALVNAKFENKNSYKIIE